METADLNTRKLLGNNVHTIISFLVPVIVSGIAYAVIGIGPFGTKTVLISNMQG